MLHFLIALYSEAKPIIKELDLKKISGDDRLQVYADAEEKYRLLITGVGYVAALTAVSAYLASNKVNENDIMINIGTCCRQVPYGFLMGDVKYPLFLINKLTDGVSGRTFYPDVMHLEKLQLEERAIISSAKPVEKTDRAAAEQLYDMEAAFIYQAAITGSRTDQLFFVKIVTDDGVSIKEDAIRDFDRISQEAVEERISDIREIVDTLVQISGIRCENIRARIAASPIYEQLAGDILASETMRNQLLQLMVYSRLEKLDMEGIVQGMYDEEVLPCRKKAAGKAALQILSDRILGVSGKRKTD